MGRGRSVKADLLKNLVAPVASPRIDQLRMRRIGVFGDRRTRLNPAEVVQQIFGNVEPSCTGLKAIAPVSVQLVQGIEAEELYARQLVQSVWRNACPDFGHGSFGARVAITERVIERPAVRVQPDIVNRPAVDAHGIDGGASIRQELGRKAETLFCALTKSVKLPIEVAITLNRPILKAMNKVHLSYRAVPLGERNAAASGT